MPQIDDLLHAFRADVPPPAPGAAERIAARARGTAPGSQSPTASVGRVGRPRRRVRGPLIAVAAGIAAAAVTLIVALSPGGDGGGPAAGTLLERAEAAVTPREQILALTIRMRTTTSDPAVVPEDRERDIRMREYVLAGAGDAVLTRRLITEGAWTDPPTDEDSTIQLDRDGNPVEFRTWTPLDPARAGGGLPRAKTGELSLDTRFPRSAPAGVDPTLTGMLRHAYERGELRPIGPRDGDSVLLRGHLVDGGCGHTEVSLDPQTFIPRRIEVAIGRGDFRTNECDPEPPVETQLWTIDARQLEASDRNRRLLEIGSWPTARYELNGKQVDRDELPPRPPLASR